MTDTSDRPSGRCLCGGVSYRIDVPIHRVLHCHCSNCRRISGNFVAASRCATSDLQIDDPGDRLRWVDVEFASYGFCSRCGSTLFFRAVESQEVTSVMVGTLDDATGLALGEVWFAGEAQPHNTMPDDVPHHEGNG